MTGAQIVEKFLAEIGNRLGIEHEEIRFRVDDDAVSLRHGRRDIDVRRGRRFVKRGVDFLGHLQVWLENQDAAAYSGLVSGMARRRVVHNEIGAGVCAPGHSRAAP